MHVSQYKQLFLSEAALKLKHLEDVLILLEKNPHDKKGIDAILQQLHALKGDAATMNYQALANALHQVEDLFIGVRQGNRSLGSDSLDACFMAIDAFRRNLDSIRESDSEIDLGPAIAFTLRPSGKKTRAADQAAPQAQTTSDTTSSIYAPLSSYVDISSAELENAYALVNDIVISQQQLQRVLHSNDIGALKVGLYNLATHASDLRKAIIDMKLIPVRQYFAFLSRLVRDLSRQQKKFITFEFKDHDMRFESQVLEALREACVQLIKNAVDHGFREGDTGVIRLSFDLRAGAMHVMVSDTGHGIDWDALERSVLRNNRTTKQKLMKMKPELRMQFLIGAGVSSREQASLVSGRGVGLPFVRSVLEGLHGTMEMRSANRGKNKGTTFELIVPLAPTLFRALTWQWGAYYLALPLFTVEKIIQLPSDGAVPTEYRYRNAKVPVRTIGAFVDGADASALHAVAVAIVVHEGRRCALFLPSGVQEQELLAQSLPVVQKSKLVSSAAVSEEGIPVTIVNHRVLFEHIV